MLVSLEDFVSGTLVQIVRAAVTAKKELGDGVNISPNEMKPCPVHGDAHLQETPLRHSIEFDLMISAEDATGSTGKAGAEVKVMFVSVNAGGEMNSTVKTGMVNRVKFTVPLEYDVKRLLSRPSGPPKRKV